MSIDPRDGQIKRYHLDGSSFQKALKVAKNRVGIYKRVTSHTFRHCFATHLLMGGIDIRSIQELLGHKDVSTTMIYIHVMREQMKATLKSPLDF